MENRLKNCINWLLPVFLILFIAEVIVLPVAIKITYAGRSENPDHTLTYRKGNLTWSNVKGINEHGEAELSVFDAEYSNVSADDGQTLIAPGTEGKNLIRLQNDSSDKIMFTAVVYSIKDSDNLPVKVSFMDGDFTDTEEYFLSNGVDKTKIVRSVNGSVNKNEIVDFEISWLWDYELSYEKDMFDVDFGNRSANGNPDEVKVGFYLVVKEGNEVHSPKTGDNANMTMYLVLMGISGIMLLILFVTGKRVKSEV